MELIEIRRKRESNRKKGFKKPILKITMPKGEFNFNDKSVFYHNLPMTHMAGFLNLIILPLVSGSKIIIDREFQASSIASFWDNPIKYGANVFWFVPVIIDLLVNLDRGDKGVNYFKSVRGIGCVGTAPLKYLSKCKFEEKYGNIKLYESYGLSETLFVSTNTHTVLPVCVSYQPLVPKKNIFIYPLPLNNLYTI